MFRFADKISIEGILDHMRLTIEGIPEGSRKNKLSKLYNDRLKTMKDIQERMDSLNKAMVFRR